MLLATELLPLLKSSSRLSGKPSHLTFVSSRTAPIADITWKPPRPITDWSQPESFPPKMIGGQTLYARSKLLLEYSMRRLVQAPYLAQSDSATGLVIVNSVCPGVTQSDLGREFKSSFVWSIAMRLFFLFLAKSAEKGANCYISALQLGPKSIGQMWTASDRFEPEFHNLTSAKGKELGDAVWEEMRQILLDNDASLEEILGSK